MIWASREDRPAVRGSPGVLTVLMRPPLLALASVQEGTTVCMLSSTTVHTARAKFLAKGTSPRLSKVAVSSWMYQKTGDRPSFGTSTPAPAAIGPGGGSGGCGRAGGGGGCRRGG